MGLVVELLIHLPSVGDRSKAEALVAHAHQRCPYSNAIRGNVDVTLTIT
jgi:organic hydroperoxide reductase OsmC/OhrA